MDDNIFWGGPTYKILKKMRLEKELESVNVRKIIFFTLFTWLPLLIINIFQSTVLNPELKISFLTDYVVWARFFLALPTLFIAERFIKFHVGNSILHFMESGLISENIRENYKSLILKFIKIRDSKIAELIILIFAYSVVLMFWKINDEKNFNSTWIFNSNREITIAGYWYYFVSAPVFQFFLYRMVWKFIVWAIFLFRVSRMDLNLIPTDPDLSGGLKFLGIAQLFFGIIGLAQSFVVSAQYAEQIIINKTQLADLKISIIINVLTASLLLLSPLLFFVKKLTKVKLKGIIDYGVVAHKYVHSFDNKWVKGINPENENLLGTSDIQSLADLYNSFQVVEKMRVFPIEIKQIIYLIVLLALPFLPLIAFVIPPREILEALIKFFI